MPVVEMLNDEHLTSSAQILVVDADARTIVFQDLPLNVKVQAPELVNVPAAEMVQFTPSVTVSPFTLRLMPPDWLKVPVNPEVIISFNAA